MRIIAQCGWMAGKGCGYNPLFFGLVMPFTLAHPAAVLPLARSRLHFPALLLGVDGAGFRVFSGWSAGERGRAFVLGLCVA